MVPAAGGSLVAAMRRSGASTIAVGTELVAIIARCVVPGATVVRASAGAIVTSADAAVMGGLLYPVPPRSVWSVIVCASASNVTPFRV